MPTCFVMQPFDGGKFDKRFDDVFGPAITAAGLEAYRVDKDPSTSIPIDDIEAGIRGAAVCFADITTDNPNVWFELGIAIAERKPIVLVCSDERKTRYPFDVQHRTVIAYKTESLQDYQALAEKVTTRLTALLAKSSTLEAVAQASPLRPVEGLEPQEIVALITVAENLDDPSGLVDINQVRQDMERAGFTRIAVTLALAVLYQKQMVYTGEITGWNESSVGYGLKPAGMQWLIDNKHLLTLKTEGRRVRDEPTASGLEDDDIPF